MADPLKWSDEFVERRLREHREFQELALDVIVEGAIVDAAHELAVRRSYARRDFRVHRRVLPLRSSPRLSPREGQPGETGK